MTDRPELDTSDILAALTEPVTMADVRRLTNGAGLNERLTYALESPATGERYSADAGDYWQLPDFHVFTDSEGESMILTYGGQPVGVRGGAVVMRADGATRAVQNLGWLLSGAWERFTPLSVTVRRRHFREPRADAVLIVRLGPRNALSAEAVYPYNARADKFYACGFADASVLLDWLTRPRFGGLPLNWFGLPSTVPASKRELHARQAWHRAQVAA